MSVATIVAATNIIMRADHDMLMTALTTPYGEEESPALGPIEPEIAFIMERSGCSEVVAREQYRKASAWGAARAREA